MAAQVYRHMYDFLIPSLPLIKRVPAKSNPVFCEGGSMLTRLGGNGRTFSEEKDFASSRLQVTHFFKGLVSHHRIAGSVLLFTFGYIIAQTMHCKAFKHGYIS